MPADPSRIAVAETIDEVRDAARVARAEGKIVGLVPTMGALHEGHARLIETCRAESDFVVVSIYVNTSQFGPSDDFARYPKTPEADLETCRNAGAHLVFMPPDQEMYPRGHGEMTAVEVPGPSGPLEGVARPGHFRGVATVVLKLLNIVGPDLAHFGEKDYQQLLVIRRMAADLDLPATIRGVPTVREPDGLAMSSRNRYLGPEDRAAATALRRALLAARAVVEGGERSVARVRQEMARSLESEPRVAVEYAEVVDAETLGPIDTLELGVSARALIAARVGPARLIDNDALPPIRAGS